MAKSIFTTDERMSVTSGRIAVVFFNTDLNGIVGINLIPSIFLSTRRRFHMPIFVSCFCFQFLGILAQDCTMAQSCLKFP